jgi:peptide maturation system protein (TIGR04066 family)
MFGVDDKILLYPFDRESLPVIKGAENFLNIRIYRLVAPESWGHDDECYKCSEDIVNVSHDYESGLDDCSAVWIVDSWNELDFSRFIEPAIRLASIKGKRVVCSRCLTSSEKALLFDLDVIYVDYSSFAPTIASNDRVLEIRVPVIYVMSVTEFCNQFYIETAICAELRNRGYDTLLISSRKESIIFGGYTVPDFMFHGEYSENDKVLAINQYIRNLEMEHQPEIIVIGVPGNVMPYHYQYSSDFGVIAYEISEAAKPDFAILLSPCMQYEAEFFKGIEDSLRGRLGVHVDVHSMSPYTLDFSAATIEKSLSYLSVDDSYVCDMIKRADYVNLLNLNNVDGISSAVDRLIDKLSGNLGSLIV